MKNLIIYCHPNPKSFNRAIFETVKETLKNSGHEVKTRELYELDFSPVLKPADFEAMHQKTYSPEVLAEQNEIKWADQIIIVSPVWWFSLPAMLKGYIDRVFSFGFAYSYTKDGPVGLLKNKKVAIFNTTGGAEDFYKSSGMINSLKQTIDDGIFGFCGMEVVLHKYFFGVPATTPEVRAGMLAEAKVLASKF